MPDDDLWFSPKNRNFNFTLLQSGLNNKLNIFNKENTYKVIKKVCIKYKPRKLGIITVPRCPVDSVSATSIEVRSTVRSLCTLFTLLKFY